jgi:hypothetical protein
MPRKIVTFEDIDYCIALGPKRLFKVQSLQHKRIPKAIREKALALAEERGLVDDEGKIDPLKHSELVGELLPEDTKSGIRANIAFETCLLCVELKNEEGKWKLMTEEFLEVDMPSLDHLNFLVTEIAEVTMEVAGKGEGADTKKKTLISEPSMKPSVTTPSPSVKV